MNNSDDILLPSRTLLEISAFPNMTFQSSMLLLQHCGRGTEETGRQPSHLGHVLHS